MIGVNLLNLWSLGPADQDRACAEWSGQANSLAPGQIMQVVVESNPLQPAAVIAGARAFVTSRRQILHDLADHSLAALQAEMARKHVPDLRGYLIVGPAPETKLGLARAVTDMRAAVGMRRRKREVEPDRRGLDTAVDDVVGQCSAMEIGARQLRRADVLALLWRTINPGQPQPSALDQSDDLAAMLTPNEWRETFDGVQLGPTHTRSLYLLTPPDLTNPGWLGDLIALDCTLRLSWHLRGLDRDRERTRLLRKRKAAAGVLAGELKRAGLANLDAESLGYDAGEQAMDLLQATVGITQSTLIVTLQASDTDTLDVATARARSVIRTRLGARLGSGRGYQGPLWRASLPLAQNAVKHRAKRWRTETTGNGFPFLSQSPGMRRGIPLGFTTRGHELVNVDLSDPSLPNWVVNILGRQGSGKTFLSQILTLWTLYQGGRATVIDRAGHYRTLIDLVGGAYIALGKDAMPRTINLWDIRPGEDVRSKIDVVLAAHEIMLTRPGQHLDPRAEALLEAAIRHVYDRHSVLQTLGQRDASTFPLERELVTYLESLAATEGLAESERDLVRTIHDTLLPYVGDGRYAALVDRPTTVDVETPLLCFDLDRLPEKLYALAMFTISEAVARRASNTYDRHGELSHELLAIDEGWFVAKYAGAGAWLNDIARRSRHLGLRFVFITQQLSDLIDNPTAVSIFNAASMKCLFRQQDARSSHGSTIDWLATQLNISGSEAAQLTQLRNGQMMLFREGKDGSYRRGVVDVTVSPYDYWIFTSEPNYDVPTKLQAIANAGGDTWTAIKNLVAQDHRGRRGDS